MKTKNERIADIALQYSPESIVDVGYAQEPNPALARHGARVFGVDLVEALAPYEKTFVCDLNKDRLPFENGSISVVTMGCTLAHVANPLRVLADIHRVLVPGGRLVVSTPNPHYYWEMMLNVFYHFFKKRVSRAKHVEHFFEFSRFSMRTLAGRAGFGVEKETGTSFHIVMTPWHFGVPSYPGVAYEIIYTLKKEAAPASYATFESKRGIERIPTNLFS